MHDYTPETGDAADKVLKVAIKRRQMCLDAEGDTRNASLDDLKFASGDQWPDRIQSDREIQHRPCLTVNKTGKFLRQVVNDSRQNKPAIHVFPVDSGNDKDTASVFNGMIRDIEQRTDADVAYDTAIESAARCGEGYFRLINRYADDDTMEQELAFMRIRNPFAVHMDPAAIDPAGSDATYGFIDSWVDVDELREEYPDIGAGLDTGIGHGQPSWIDGNKLLVAEYYAIERDQPRTLALLKTGAEVYLEDVAEQPEDGDIVAQRTVRVTRCIWRKITASHVLEKTVWPCRYIPIFRVIGEEFEIEGKVKYQGLVRDMKDSQRMYNYWLSNATEKGALETKAPYIGAEGQFEGHEREWQNANRLPLAYLEYKPIDVEGNLAPPPARNTASFAGQVDVEMARLSAEDMQETTGIYNAGLGAESNEKSGKAIMARQRESDTGTFHYIDNLARAIRHAGRVLCHVLPAIYTEEKIVRIIGEDGSEDTVKINTEEKDEKTNGIKRVNDITVGRYDVRVAVGPSYTTRRIEAGDSMISFVQAVPAAGQSIMDLVAKTMDWPGADEIAERLKKMIPPNLLGDDEQGRRRHDPGAGRGAGTASRHAGPAAV